MTGIEIFAILGYIVIFVLLLIGLHLLVNSFKNSNDETERGGIAFLTTIVGLCIFGLIFSSYSILGPIF